MAKLLLLISCITAVIADMLLVWFAKKETHPTFVIVVGIFLVNVAALVWTHTMKSGIESAKAITFYALFTVIGCSFLGVVVFHEPLSMINAVGMGLGLLAIIMISI